MSVTKDLRRHKASSWTSWWLCRGFCRTTKQPSRWMRMDQTQEQSCWKELRGSLLPSTFGDGNGKPVLATMLNPTPATHPNLMAEQPRLLVLLVLPGSRGD